MSTASPTLPNLQQRQVGPSSVALLDQFGQWLQGAQFEDVGGGSQRCVDRDVRRNINALLSELGVSSLVSLPPISPQPFPYHTFYPLVSASLERQVIHADNPCGAAVWFQTLGLYRLASVCFCRRTISELQRRGLFVPFTTT